MSTRKCKGPCGETRAVEEFSWKIRAKGKREARCKVCRKAAQKQYREENRDQISAQRRQYREANREEISAWMQQYRQTPEARAARNAAERARDATVEGKLLKKNRELHRRFYKGIKLGPVTTQRGEALVGCTRQQYRDHLASQFRDDMTHENHGRGNDNWQIDHIIPKAAFKGELEANLQMIYWWGNVQPLWGPENTAKGDKYSEENKQGLITKYHEWVRSAKPPPVH